MKRRTFILVTTSAVALSVLPTVKHAQVRFSPKDPLLRPGILAQFCDRNEIVAIGSSYRTQVPSENEKQILTSLLLTDERGIQRPQDNEALITQLITQKVEKDFKENRTFIANGWIISETEARQCALVSLSINS